MSFTEMAEELIRIRGDSGRRQSSEAMKKYTSGEMYVMNYLFSHGNTAYPKELCSALSVSTARIARILNVLEEKGIIRRTDDAADNRRKVVYLTEKGISTIRQVGQEITGYLSAILEMAGETDAAEYIRLEKKLADLMKIRPYREWKRMCIQSEADSRKEETNGSL